MGLWICSEKHEEMCHEGEDQCPACKVIAALELSRDVVKETLDHAEEVIVMDRARILDLQQQVMRLESEFEAYEKTIGEYQRYFIKQEITKRQE